MTKTKETKIIEEKPLVVKSGEILGLIDDLSHLVTEKLKLKVKGHAYLLIEHLKPLMSSYNKLKDEFIKKNGSGDKEKGYSIGVEDWKKMSEEAKKEWEEMNDEEHKVETKLKLSFLEDIESSHPYQFLYKVLNR